MPRVRPRPLAPVLVAVACAAAVGCLGPHNPSYFPYLASPGQLTRTHAKPPGRGYFKDFDPKAARLEVTPHQCAAPTRTQQVLIATVYDKDGQPRRKRRVEWIIDGPGYIVEVDESGFFDGRGGKVDNKYAVSYTDYFEHKITRGNDDPRDDFTVAPGQTWCVVSSAVEGETTVTAYAPEVFDWEKGRVTVKLVWADSQFVFPPPVISRTGGEADLLTTLNRFSGKESPDGLKVRYRVLDGAPAELVTQSGTGTTTTLSGGGQKQAEVAADAEGKAAVRVVQPTPQGGTTRIAVEVVKPDPNGLGAGTVIGRQETTVEWATAQLALDAEGPRTTGVGRETTLTVNLTNGGKADSQPVTLKAALPGDLEFLRADPAPTAREEGRLTWSLGPVPAGEKQSITLTVRPQRRGSLTIPLSAESADGFRAQHRATVGADQAGLKVEADVPKEVGLGERMIVRLKVHNPATLAAENATAWVGFDAGLGHESEANPVEVAIGTIPPKETKEVEVRLTARGTGRSAVRISVTADGGLSDRTESTVTIQKAALKVTLVGPESIPLNRDETWELRVVNTGDGAVADVLAQVSLPECLLPRSASDGGKVTADGAEWRLATLAAGETRTLRLTATADRLTERGRVTASARGRNKVGAEAELPVAVTGQPALVLELADAPTMVPAGRKTTARILVRNRGTAPAKRVDVSISALEALSVTGGMGADRQPGEVHGRTVRFGMLDELPPGKVAVYEVEVEGSKAGIARLLAEVRAEHLTQPLREEQAARVVAGEAPGN